MIRLKRILSGVFAILLTASFHTFGYNEKTFIPAKAPALLPIVVAEQEKYFPDFKWPAYFMALAEHESCVTLTSKRCMDPKSRLKTAREEGGGIYQLTRAYSPNGKIRFDSLAAMKRAHNAELKELQWGTIYQRQDLQIRAGILMTRDNWQALYNIKEPYQRLQFTDSAYNGGMGGVNRRRRACGLTKGCDATKWFNHVEKHCPGLKKAIYGKRSACDINNQHVRNVLLVKSPKYEAMYNEYIMDQEYP